MPHDISHYILTNFSEWLKFFICLINVSSCAFPELLVLQHWNYTTLHQFSHQMLLCEHLGRDQWSGWNILPFSCASLLRWLSVWRHMQHWPTYWPNRLTSNGWFLYMLLIYSVTDDTMEFCGWLVRWFLIPNNWSHRLQCNFVDDWLDVS